MGRHDLRLGLAGDHRPFAGSAVLLFAWYLSARRAPEAVLPLRLFRNSVFVIASAIGLAAGFAMFGALAYLPLFLQVVTASRRRSPGSTCSRWCSGC